MITIVVFGASGDLARRKTFPALFSLFRHGFLQAPFRVIGYARTVMDQAQFRAKLIPFMGKVDPVKEDPQLLDRFLGYCLYRHGAYDREEDYLELEKEIGRVELEHPIADETVDDGEHTRIFYLALPPSVFIQVARGIHDHLCLSTRNTRVVVEKPFGKDLESSNELSSALSALFAESQLYRIDHYLGKEMVKSLMALRFGNLVFNELWNRHCIASVQIVFKETLGVEGRGGYFDEYGIVRDVMQNHLLQMLTIVAMERPCTLGAEDVRDEKVKVLKGIRPLTLDRAILGQYTKSADGTKPGYTDDPTIPAGSRTPTFAMAVLYVDNERWEGVPFVLRSGKALNEQKTEIRIQFRDVPGLLFPSVERNELVIRVQPNEAVYLKMMVKRPGLLNDPIVSDLDLSYATRYHDLRIPEAYESLLLDVIAKADHSNFVRSDELEAAWRIFTPLLREIDDRGVVPVPYPHGSRGPVEADDLLGRLGYKRQYGFHNRTYSWPTQHLD